MFDSQPIYAAATACRKCLAKCLSIPRLKENGWAENRLVDFNLWSAGAGVSAKGKLSLDQRLSTEPDIQNAIVNLLELLQMFVENCQDEAKDLDGAYHEPSKTDGNTEPANAVKTSVDQADEPSALELSPEEIESRRDVEVTLDQIIRLTVAIRKAGSNARLKRADRKFNMNNPGIQELKGFLELLVHPRGLKKEGQLTPIQVRLVEANLRRWHRFSYARLHSKKLARSDMVPMETISEVPVFAPDNTSQLDSKPTISFDIPEIQEVTETVATTPQDEPPRAVSIIAPTATTAASAIEGNIIVPDKPMARNPATVISRVSSKIVYPRPPIVSRYKTVFKCPCCLQSLPVAYTERTQWKKHLASDILPYTCVFENCPQPLQLYLTRKDWEHHIKTEHGQLWSCAVCEQLGVTTEFSNEDDLVDHIGTIHKDSVDSDEIPMFVTASSSSKPIAVIECPICTGPEEGEDSLEHIAHCVHDFSLSSLPLPTESDAEEDYFDVDSRNSDAQNTPSSCSVEERDIEGLPELIDVISNLGDENLTREDDHKVSESSLKALIRDSSGSKGISILDWRSEPATEDPQTDSPTDTLGEVADVPAEITEEKTVADANRLLSSFWFTKQVAEKDLYSPEQRARYRIAWLCLSKMDGMAAKELLDHVDLVPLASQASGSMFDYILGFVEPHIVVVAWPSESAMMRYPANKWCLATEVTKAFRSLEIFLHVGTTAGIPSMVHLSDIVVGPLNVGGIFEYSMKGASASRRRSIELIEQSDHFKKAPEPIQCVVGDFAYIATIEKLELNTKIPGCEWIADMLDVHFAPTVAHIDDGEGTCRLCYHSDPEKILVEDPDPKKILKLRRYGRPSIFYDGIACGSVPAKNHSDIEELSQASVSRDLPIHCVETEGGLWPHSDIDGLLVIRSISNYTDEHKDIRWKRIATVAAATYTVQILRKLKLGEAVRPPLAADDYDDFIEPGLLGQEFDDNAPDSEAKLDDDHDYEDFIDPRLLGENENPETVEIGPDGSGTIGEQGSQQISCLFLALPCPYKASSFDDWAEHISKHLEPGGVPDIWSCDACRSDMVRCDGRYPCQNCRYNLRSCTRSPVWKSEIEVPLSWTCGFETCGKSQVSHATASLHSKLVHIYDHLTKDGWDLKGYAEEPRWIDYFESIPITPLETDSAPEEPQALRLSEPNSATVVEDIDPSWKPLLSELYELGITDEMIRNNSDFIREYVEQNKASLFKQKLPDTSINSDPPPPPPPPPPLPDFLIAQKRYSESRTLGTLLWFPKLQKFKEWEDNPGFSLLCTGLLGAGKTYITAFVYSTLRARYGPNIGISVIYSDEYRTVDQRLMLKSMLQSIRGQFAQQIGITEQSFSSVDELTSSLKTLVGKFSRKFILIDGLDELELWEDWGRFVNIAGDLKQSCGVNCFYTSRPAAKIVRRGYHLHIGIDELSTSNDIEKFLHYEFSKCPGILSRDASARDECIKNIRTMAGGVFLIASLFAKYVATIKPETVDELRILESDPFYDDFYTDFGNSIGSDTHPDGRRLGLVAAALISYAGPRPRPFSARELGHALRVHESPIFGTMQSGARSFYEILAYCHGLLSYDEDQDIVKLFHPTAEEFLKRFQWWWYPGGQISAAKNIIRYLSSNFQHGACQRKRDYDRRLESETYFRRAALEWGYLVESSPRIEDFEVLHFLKNDNLMAAIAQVLKTENELRPDFKITIEVKGIHIAAHFGILWVIEHLVNEQGVNALDYCRHTPMAWAIAARQRNMVILLAHKGARLTDIKHTGSTALLEAIYLKVDNVEIVHSLIDCGADPNEEGKLSESTTKFTPLNLAILQENTEITKLLVSKGADVNARDGRDRTPLLCAALVHNIDLVDFLIVNGAELDAPVGLRGITVLGYAASANFRSIVELLVRYGANVKHKSKYDESSVDLARMHGNDGIARFLINKGGSEHPRTKGIARRPPQSRYRLAEDFPPMESMTVRGSIKRSRKAEERSSLFG